MKILLVNKFLYPHGGDATSTLATGKILKAHGHEVVFWGMDHPENPEYLFTDLFVSYVDYDSVNGLATRASMAVNILYSFEARKKMAVLLKKIKPDVVHLNNFAHQISPSILDAIKDHGIPVVMTMHDYKLVCPTYTLLNNGKPCQKCTNDKYYHCLLNKCTKSSILGSLVNTAEMYLHHRFLHIYDKIDLYIAPSRFMMKKVSAMGFKGTILYLPNFVWTEKFEPIFSYKEKALYYAGRLSEEKGLFTLIEAVKDLDMKLIIIGDGPLREELKKRKGDNTYFMGYMPQQRLKKVAKDCMAMVIPSEWYENNPRSVLEAFAMGKAVLGARIGGIPELVKNEQTGLTFEPGNVNDLRQKIKKQISMPSRQVRAMGKAARMFAEENFNPEKHYQGLMEIYHKAMVVKNG